MKNNKNRFNQALYTLLLLSLFAAPVWSMDNYDYNLDDDIVEDLVNDFKPSAALKLQNILRGDKERKKLEDLKKASLYIQNIVRGNNSRTLSNDLKQKALLKQGEKLKKLAVNFKSDFEKQVKSMVVNLATSVGEEHNTEKIADETKKLIQDIKAGAQIVHAVNFEKKFSWDDLIESYKEDYVNAYIKIVQQLCSYCYYLNAQQRTDGVGFEEGTFFIETTNNRWQTFFEKLGKQASASKRPSAYYLRISSHDLGKECYGMDFRTNENDSYTWLYRFKTFLISETDHGIWIKPEHCGCYYWSETPTHLKGWLESQKGRLLDDDYYNKSQWNKERTPDKVIKEFKKLFPDYEGKKTLCDMYKHALNNKQSEFARTLKQEYSNIEHRHGRECYIDTACLLESLCIAEIDNEAYGQLRGLYCLMKQLKHHLALLKQGELDAKELLKKIQEIVSHIQKSLYSIDGEHKQYCKNLVAVMDVAMKHKDALKILTQEPLFEVEFQKEFLLSEEQRKEKEQKLKQEALNIKERDAKKIALAQDLWEILIDHCKKSNEMLDKLAELTTVQENLSKAPAFRSKESKNLQIHLSNADISNAFEEVFGLENLYDHTLFTATHNLNNDTTGLRKINELRMFNYISSNPYVKEYSLYNMECINDLAIRICAIAWTVKADSGNDKKMVIVIFNQLYKLWNVTLEKLYTTLEKHGYAYISKKGIGKEITDIIIDTTKSQVSDIKNSYKNLQETFEKTINESGLSDNNKKRFVLKYNELSKAVVDELDFTITNLFDFICIRIQAAKTEDELKDSVSSCLLVTLRQYDWKNPMVYSAERLKLFHEIALKELAKEENKDNLNTSMFGINLINKFDKKKNH